MSLLDECKLARPGWTWKVDDLDDRHSSVSAVVLDGSARSGERLTVGVCNNREGAYLADATNEAGARITATGDDALEALEALRPRLRAQCRRLVRQAVKMRQRGEDFERMEHELARHD